MEEILACTNFEFQRDNCTKVKFLEGDKKQRVGIKKVKTFTPLAIIATPRTSSRDEYLSPQPLEKLERGVCIYLNINLGVRMPVKNHLET